MKEGKRGAIRVLDLYESLACPRPFPCFSSSFKDVSCMFLSSRRNCLLDAPCKARQGKSGQDKSGQDKTRISVPISESRARKRGDADWDKMHFDIGHYVLLCGLWGTHWWNENACTSTSTYNLHTHLHLHSHPHWRQRTSAVDMSAPRGSGAFLTSLIYLEHSTPIDVL